MRDMVRCPKCGSRNIIPDRFSETGESCLMCGTQKGFSEDLAARITTPSVAGGGKPEKKEEEMSKTVRGKCKWEGCKRIGAFWGHCKNHFRAVYGFSVEEYRANRLRPREDPRLTAERLKKAQAALAGALSPSPAPPDRDPALADSSAPIKQDAHAAEGGSVIFPQDLWNRISEIAESEYRTTGQQILYMINNAINSTPTVHMTVEISDQALEERIMRLLATSPVFRSAVRG